MRHISNFVFRLRSIVLERQEIRENRRRLVAL